MTGDVQTFVLSCPVCQVENAEHTLVCGQPETSGRDNAILNVIDRATRMVHCIPCKKTITAVQTAKNVGSLSGNYMVSLVIYIHIGGVSLLRRFGESYGLYWGRSYDLVLRVIPKHSEL